MTFQTFKLALSAKLDQYDKETNSLEDPDKPTEMDFCDWLVDFELFLDNNPEDPGHDRPHSSPTDGETEDA